MKAFLNREDAALQLATKLYPLKNENGVILAVPRGGVPMAALIAKKLNWPLDILLVKKIGHPDNPEYAIGAAGLKTSFILPNPEISNEYLSNTTDAIRKRLSEMHDRFLMGRPPLSLNGKTVIIVDDGIATGNTLRMGIKLIRESNPRKIIVAVPVSAADALEAIRLVCDEVICLQQPEVFGGVGAFYDDFSEVTDEMVIKCMKDMQKEHSN